MQFRVRLSDKFPSMNSASGCGLFTMASLQTPGSLHLSPITSVPPETLLVVLYNFLSLWATEA